MSRVQELIRKAENENHLSTADLLLVESSVRAFTLRLRRGDKSPITGKEIAQRLAHYHSSEYPGTISDATVRKIIHHIRAINAVPGAMICAGSRGYWPETEVKPAKQYVDGLLGRLAATAVTYRAVKHQLFELANSPGLFHQYTDRIEL